MEENVRICDICGCEIKEEEGTWVDDQFLCQECVDEHCTTCDHCGETIWANDSVQDDNITLCQTCYDDHYHRCECCGRIIHDNSTNWQGDMPYCDSCYDEFNDEIEEYSYKPKPVFYGDGKRYLGVELEVDCGGKDDDNASKLKEIANSIHEHIYIKSDGSIDDGFEIVSHPMTLDYHHHDMDWEAILYEAIKMGYRSHQTSTCGLHMENVNVMTAVSDAAVESTKPKHKWLAKGSRFAKKAILTATAMSSMAAMCTTQAFAATGEVDTSSFISTACTVLKSVICLIGAGVGVWGVVNLLEGYGNDNPGANAHVR